MPLRRKSQVIRRLEEEHGKPVVEIVAAAINQYGEIEPAARALGVNLKTFCGWVARYRINTRTVATVEEGSSVGQR